MTRKREEREKRERILENKLSIHLTLKHKGLKTQIGDYQTFNTERESMRELENLIWKFIEKKLTKIKRED